MEQDPPLSDAALLKLLDSDEDVSWLSPDEKRRMVTLSAPTPAASHDRATPPSKSWGERATDALPTIGGMAGGLLGGSRATPIGMMLAGVGGAGGEGFRQVADSLRGDFSDVPETMGGRLKKISVEGAKQGGLEGAGKVVSAVARPIAKAVYAGVLRPSQTLMRQASPDKKLISGLTRIVDQGFEDSVLPSGAGTTRAGRLVTESADEATRMAARSPRRAQTADVLQRAANDQSDRMAAELRSPGITPNSAAVGQQISNVAGAHPPNINMATLLEMRRGADKVAKPAFDAARIPGGARVAPGTEASVARSISGAAKETLDNVLGQAFKDINMRTQGRMAVKNAVDAASARPNITANLVSGGAGVVGAMGSNGDVGDAVRNGVLLRMLLSPTLQGGAALAAGKLPYAQLLRLLMAAHESQDNR